VATYTTVRLCMALSRLRIRSSHAGRPRAPAQERDRHPTDASLTGRPNAVACPFACRSR
jgi:hypothetical protein